MARYFNELRALVAAVGLLLVVLVFASFLQSWHVLNLLAMTVILHFISRRYFAFTLAL